jgi:type II secretion system protein N
MPKPLRYLLYVLLFAVSFVFFLYASFPYDVLKDRVVGSLGRGYDISVEELSPYWFTGIDVKGLVVRNPQSEGGQELISVRRLKGRASIFSLIFGKPKISFDMELARGEISGTVHQTDEELDLDLELDDVDLKDVSIITSKTGMRVTSRIDGTVVLKMDRRNFTRSEGRIRLDMGDMKIAATEAKLGEMTLPLPEIVLSKRRGSSLDVELGKGVINFKTFKLADGDLQLDLTGKMFLSNNVSNYRFNLQGSFKAADKLSQALPFLFVVEKQKKEDGSFPLSITGRLARPAIKVGTFTLPI